MHEFMCASKKIECIPYSRLRFLFLGNFYKDFQEHFKTWTFLGIFKFQKLQITFLKIHPDLE